MSLLETEAATYTEILGAVPSYSDHSPGATVLPIFLSLVGTERGHVLDAGTGSGKGALALADAGFRVSCLDLADARTAPESRVFPMHLGSLWHPLRRFAPVGEFDWVYCTDVLEHVPPQFTMLAVEQMLRAARRGVFLSISLVPDQFGVWVGKPLHQTVQSFQWWSDSLRELGRVTDARDLLGSATYYVERA